MRILVIEDDTQTANYIARGLREDGHSVEVTAQGREGLFLATGGPFDLLIVDRMLPELDGLSVVKTLRGTGDQTPVLFLTALGGVSDRVTGLEAGGDDYLVKPFALSELLARVHALGRRPPVSAESNLLRVADLEMNLLERSVVRAGKRIDLQPREFQLLGCLLSHAGEVVTRTMLLEHVWGFHFDPQTNVCETHISRLRAKVDKPFDQPLIHTIRGAGYMLRAPSRAADDHAP